MIRGRVLLMVMAGLSLSAFAACGTNGLQDQPAAHGSVSSYPTNGWDRESCQNLSKVALVRDVGLGTNRSSVRSTAQLADSVRSVTWLMARLDGGAEAAWVLDEASGQPRAYAVNTVAKRLTPTLSTISVLSEDKVPTRQEIKARMACLEQAPPD